ncbi:MAG: hypothetical protein A3C36_01570 [Omnitrophica WOR_2 bacterium RIFCSPHIGHO2_02_FULL_52_10]|nr:MAG: hypothetical protein A3C36_01570 [Omnitrophica WOR_2 bacterium RIFCSPHIGHO2_02_FULL_52_10]
MGRSGLTVASKLTVIRILIVPFFIATVLYYSPDKDHLRLIALGLFAAAAGLDFLDGYLARKFRQETKAGAILDPLADKILLISAFICLYKIGVSFETVRFPIWLVVAVISRDVILLLGSTIIHLVKGDIAVATTVWGKGTAFVEMLAVMGILMQWRFSILLWYVIMVFVIISGMDYIIKGIKLLYNADNHR